MKFKSFALYSLFFIATLFILVYLLFPQKDAAQFLSGYLNKNNSKLELYCESVKLKMPLKLSLENPKILIDNNIQLEPGFIEIKLNPSLFFNRSKKIVFQSDLYQGSLKGICDVKIFEPLVFSKAELLISKVKIDNVRYKTELADILLGCVVNGEYKYNEGIDKNKFGTGKFIIKNFSAKITNSFFNALNLPVVNFKEIKLEFEQQSNNIVSITQCMARGPVINLKLKGDIINIAFPLSNAKLDLKGVVLQDSPYFTRFANIVAVKNVVDNLLQYGIKFNLKGTLSEPEISI